MANGVTERAAPRRDAAASVRRERLARWGIPAALGMVGLALRAWMLGHPGEMYFDEIYYAENAQQILDRGVEEGFPVHPPLGKWLIAAGMAVVSGPVGWRIVPALAGAATVALTYLFGLRLLGRWSVGGSLGRRRAIAALAALLVAVDGSALTMSRIAMLDGFVALFAVLAAWLVVVDLDQADAYDPRRPRRWLGITPARWGLGATLGGAVATKWSGLLVVGAVGLVVLVADAVRRRRATGRWVPDPVRYVLAIGVPLVALPAVLYLASYSVWFANYELTHPGEQECTEVPCEVGALGRLAGWADYQAAIWRFHTQLETDHTYLASAWGWPTLERPVVYHFEGCRAGEDDCVVDVGNAEMIVGVGNPALWWLALPAYAALGYAAAVRRRPEAAVLLTFLLAQWVPWLLGARPVFHFYVVPLVPFVALVLAWAAGELGRWRWLRWAPAGVAAVAVAVFLWMAPVWYGIEADDDVWRDRMLREGWY